jgi:catechol 2,3-dioxygenase-like lactoylglutathione lyase family enzyme
MVNIIAELVLRFERGQLSRRQLIQGLAALAAAPAVAVEAQQETVQPVNIGHVSVLVSDLKRSVDFYKTIGLSVTGEDKANKIARMGIKGTLVSLREAKPAGTIDHFAINLENFNEARVTEALKQRGLSPTRDTDTGFHVDDPDGAHVQFT